MPENSRPARSKSAEQIRGRTPAWLTKDPTKPKSRSESPPPHRLWIPTPPGSKLFTPLVMATTAIKLDLKDKNRFVRHNYNVWAHRLKTILYIKDVWDVVRGITTMLAAPAATQAHIDAWKRKDLRARAILELTIDSSMIHHIDDVATSHEAWSALSQMFATTNQSSLVHATRLFWNCKMRDSNSVEDHVMRFCHLRQKLALAGTKVTELQASVALLMSLPKKYRVFVSTQNSNLRSAAAGAVSLSNTIGALLEEKATLTSSRQHSSQSNRALFLIA